MGAAQSRPHLHALNAQRPGLTQTGPPPCHLSFSPTITIEPGAHRPPEPTAFLPARSTNWPTEYLFGISRRAFPGSHRPRHIEPYGCGQAG